MHVLLVRIWPKDTKSSVENNRGEHVLGHTQSDKHYGGLKEPESKKNHAP